MISPTFPDPLEILLAAGIITAEQHGQVLAHPHYIALAGGSSLAEHLLWMRIAEIIDEAALKRAEAHVSATYTGEERARYLKAIESALGQMLEVDEFHKSAFSRLVRADWITREEYDRALAAIKPGEALVTGPGGLLAWLVSKGIIDGTRVAAIRASGNPNGDVHKGHMLKDVTRVFGRQGLWAGQRRIFLVTSLLLAILVAWLVSRPASAPQCSSYDTRDAIERMFSMSSLDRLHMMKPDEAKSSPTLEGISEVGYASAPRVRACKATIKLNGNSHPYAFTIAPALEGESGFAVTGAQPAILEARFSHIDADGNYGNKAEPIGRAEVERAFRAGAESLSGRNSGFAAGRGLSTASGVPNEVRRKLGLSYDAPERTREIAEVEPLAPCRAIQVDRVYKCKLLVERNDPLMTVLGGTSMVTEGEFTFERDGAWAKWRTTEALPAELARAILAAELETMKKPK